MKIKYFAWIKDITNKEEKEMLQNSLKKYCANYKNLFYLAVESYSVWYYNFLDLANYRIIPLKYKMSERFETAESMFDHFFDGESFNEFTL